MRFTTPSWGKVWISDAPRAIMTAPRGEVPEWLNGAVSKTVVVLWATVGSNPTLSALTINENVAQLILGDFAS